VVHGPGTINLSLILSRRTATPSIDDAYSLWIDLLARTLRHAYEIEVVASAVDGAFCHGRYDAAVGVRKLAGTAQIRRRHGVAVHGTILVDIDANEYLDLIERAEAALGLPQRTYDRSRIAALSELARRRVDSTELAGHLARAIASLQWPG
jgi:lipoate-protein ligase A